MLNRKSLACMVLALLLALVSGAALAQSVPAIVLENVAAYADGFILTLSQWEEGYVPQTLTAVYAPEAANAQSGGILSGDQTFQTPVPFPPAADGTIVLSGLTLTPGTTYQVQLHADEGNLARLSNIVPAAAQADVIPVTPETIAFANKTETVFEGAALDLAMTLTPAGSSKRALSFASSNEKIAAVDENGVVTGIKKGKATITAAGVTKDGKKLKAKVTVQVARPAAGISLNKTEILLAMEKKAALKATLAPEGVSNRTVLYQSTNEAVATVDKKGNIKPVAVGTCQIIAASESNPDITAACTVTVIQPITKMALGAGDATLYVGETLPLTVSYMPSDASVQSATFKSKSDKIATVDANGIVTGLARGKVTITATAADGSGKKASKAITVLQQPTEITLKETAATIWVGKTKKMAATVLPKNTSDKSLVWTSSDETIATVNAKGDVTPLLPGQVTITAAAKDFPNITASCTLTVVQPATKIELDADKLNVTVQTTAQLSYVISPENTTDKTVVWQSSNPKVAIVDQNGLVTALKRGTAIISVVCQDGSKKTDKATVYVIQPLYGMTLAQDEIRVGVGDQGTLTAVLDPYDASNTKIHWSSSNTSIAKVTGSSINATVTPAAWGQVIITAVSDEGSYTDTAIVNCGDYNRAVRVHSLSLLLNASNYEPSVQLANDSNMVVTHVSFAIRGYDLSNNMLRMGTANQAYVYCSYVLQLNPGSATVGRGFSYSSVPNYTDLHRVQVAITDYVTADGMEWHIPQANQIWEEVQSPEFFAKFNTPAV